MPVKPVGTQVALMSAIAMGAGGLAFADSVVPLPAPLVQTHVIVRPSPDRRSRPPLGRLAHGESLELVDDMSPGWYHVRLSNGDTGYVSAEYTRRIRAGATERVDGPSQVQITAFPPSASETVAQLTVKTVSDPPPFGLERDYIPLMSLAVALGAVALTVYTGRQTNIRNRHETFRTFRERFETLRTEEKNRKAWSIVDFDSEFGLTPATRADLLQATSKAEMEEVAKRQAELDTHLAAMERYWIRTFDEWYITTRSGRAVGKHPPGAFRRFFRSFMVYRPLWDDYYREAITKTVTGHPALLVGLVWDRSSTKVRSIHAPAKSGPSPQADQTFLQQMWWVLPSDAVRIKASRQLGIVNAWRAKADPSLPVLQPPHAPDSRWPWVRAWRETFAAYQRRQLTKRFGHIQAAYEQLPQPQRAALITELRIIDTELNNATPDWKAVREAFVAVDTALQQQQPLVAALVDRISRLQEKAGT